MAKSIKIIKDKEQYKPGKFAQYSQKGFSLAAQKLNRYGLLLWMYLCNNADGYNLVLSPTAIANELGVSIDVAKSMTKATGGIKELEAAGFLRDGVFYADGGKIESKERSKNSSENETSSEKVFEW